jgi:hypothetical protein
MRVEETRNDEMVVQGEGNMRHRGEVRGQTMKSRKSLPEQVSKFEPVQVREQPVPSSKTEPPLRRRDLWRARE